MALCSWFLDKKPHIFISLWALQICGPSRRMFPASLFFFLLSLSWISKKRVWFLDAAEWEVSLCKPQQCQWQCQATSYRLTALVQGHGSLWKKYVSSRDGDSIIGEALLCESFCIPSLIFCFIHNWWWLHSTLVARSHLKNEEAFCLFGKMYQS